MTAAFDGEGERGELVGGTEILHPVRVTDDDGGSCADAAVVRAKGAADGRMEAEHIEEVCADRCHHAASRFRPAGNGCDTGGVFRHSRKRPIAIAEVAKVRL